MKKIRLTEKDLMRIVKRTISEGSKGENYMFFSNLKQMRRQIDTMLNEFDSDMVNDVLNNGHDWADDKISESKTNIDSVFDFFMNKTDDGYKDKGRSKEFDDMMGNPLDNMDFFMNKTDDGYKDKVMSKKAIDKLVKELVSDGRHGDDAAFDIADGILYDEEGLAAGIKKHFNVSDAQGWLADRIA
jgi:hypothetical protein